MKVLDSHGGLFLKSPHETEAQDVIPPCHSLGPTPPRAQGPDTSQHTSLTPRPRDRIFYENALRSCIMAVGDVFFQELSGVGFCWLVFVGCWLLLLLLLAVVGCCCCFCCWVLVVVRCCLWWLVVCGLFWQLCWKDLFDNWIYFLLNISVPILRGIPSYGCISTFTASLQNGWYPAKSRYVWGNTWRVCHFIHHVPRSCFLYKVSFSTACYVQITSSYLAMLPSEEARCAHLWSHALWLGHGAGWHSLCAGAEVKMNDFLGIQVSSEVVVYVTKYIVVVYVTKYYSAFRKSTIIFDMYHICIYICLQKKYTDAFAVPHS